MKYARLLVAFSLLLFSCSKENVVPKENLLIPQPWSTPADTPPVDTGKVYPPPPGGWGEYPAVYDELFSIPCPSPTDNDMFAYVVHKWSQNLDTSFSHAQLRIHNVRTGGDYALVKDMNLNAVVSWSSTGWILFSADFELYKIRMDGTGLTRLYLYGIGPSWSPSGEKFHAWNGGGYIADKNGNIKSNDLLGGSGFQWADEDNVYAIYNTKNISGLGLYNCETNEFVKKYDIPKGHELGELQWLNDYTVMWISYAENVIYRLNLNTNKLIAIRKLSYSYTQLRLSADHDYVYSLRSHDYNYSALQKKAVGEMVRMNVNTGELEKIKLP